MGKQKGWYSCTVLTCLVCLIFDFIPMAMAEDAVTPAWRSERVATPANRVLARGTHVLDAASLEGVTNLTVSRGAIAVIDFSNINAMNLAGNLTNRGTVYVTNADPEQLTATIAGSNIYNNARALMTNVLPAGGVAGFSASNTPLNLSLNTINDIVNAGTITSSGNLTMSAGGSIVNALPQGMTGAQPVIQALGNVNLFSGTGNITNAGLIASLNNNINIAALATTTSINVFGAGGTFQALNGNINLRDASYSGPGNLNLVGGDYLCQKLNLYSGTGTAIVDVGELTGHVNTYAGAEHIFADTSVLRLGNNISIDPTYYNTGDIEILGTVESDEGLAIVAGGDITANVNGQIVTNGHNLLMIAGANVTCPSCTSPGTVGPTSGGTTPTSGVAEVPALGTVSVDLTGGTGGNIDLSGSLVETVIDTSSSNSAGGNVTLVALADGFGLEGTVALNTLCLLGNCVGGINTSGGGAGGGGNVAIYAGASSLSPVTSITTNKIETTSSGTLNSGSVTLETTQAVTSDSQPLILDAHAKIISGNTIQPGATLSMAGISTGNIYTVVNGGSQKAGDVTIKAYGDIDTSAGTIATINNGVGAAGEVTITSTNGSVSTGEIDSFVYSGWLAAANVTISAYGNITTNGNFIYAFQGGSGAGGTITLTSTNGSVSTGVLLTGVGDTVAAGNIVISAYGNITTDKIYAFNVGTGGGGTVAFTSSNGSISTKEIDTNTLLGLVPAGNVTLSAFGGDITVDGKIDASNAGISTGGSVTLLALGSLTTGDINTSTSGSQGGSITAAAAGNNSSYSILMGDLITSGSVAAGFVEIASTNLLEMPNFIGTITAQASGQSGVGGSVGIATRGTLAVGNIDTTNTSTSTSGGAQSGSVFLSSGSTASDAILAGDINAYNSANGSATGQVILIASGTIGVLGTITTAPGNSSVNPSYTSSTTSISSSTTIDVSVAGISGPSSNYNPQGYLFMSGGSTQLTIDSGGNSSLLVPLLCLTTVSIDSINSNSGTNADGVALVAGGDISLGATVGVNTVGTTSGGNVNLLSITGPISVNGLSTGTSGTGAAGSVSVLAAGSVAVSGAIDTTNSGSGAGGTVFLVSSSGTVSAGEIDTYVSSGSQAAGNVNISGFGDVNTSSNAIKSFNAGTGAGGTVFLVSSNGSVSVGEIDTYVSTGSAVAGNVFIAAYGDIDTNSNAIAAYNAGSGLSGNVILISSNSTVATGAIDTYVAGIAGVSEKAADVTVSAYGAIILTGGLNAYNTGSGSGSTVNLLSGNGSVTTGSINVNVSVASIVAGNVNIEASGDIDTSAGTIQAVNGGTRPIDSGVTLLSHTGSVTTGEIDISVTLGSAALAGNVSISAPLSNIVSARIDASNNGTGGGGTVTLVSGAGSVTADEIDTYVKSGSQTAGSVSILAVGLINVSGVIDASNGGIGASGAGTAGTVTLMSNTSSVTTDGINTNVYAGSAVAGYVTILAKGTITASGTINASNAGTGPGGEIALTSATGSVSIDGIQTYVSGGSAAAGNVIISSPGAISATGAIATNNTALGAGGSVALISSSTIHCHTITSSGAPSGSVFLSSGDTGTGAIVTGAITLDGGTLLATAAKSGTITVQLFTDGNTLSVDDGQIFATGTYTSAINILPLAFTNSATATITPAAIPGGGFTSFSNSGTVTLANDAGSSGNVITFSDLLPVFVQGTVSSLGTINDSTGQANFFVMTPTVSITSATTYTSTIGSLSILSNTMSLAAINTNGVNLSLTAVESITTGLINTSNSFGTRAGNAKLLSVVNAVTTEAIDTYITSGSASAGNVSISAYGTISTNKQAINASNSGLGTGGTINLTTSGAGSVEIGQIKTNINNASSNAQAGSITILAAAAINTNQQTINASNLGTGAGGTLALTSETFSITISDIDTHVAGGSAPAGNVFISALQLINTGNINASNAGAGHGGSVTLVRAAAMGTADIDTSSTGSAGGSITAASVGDNGVYTLVMGNLQTSGFTAAGSIMLVGDDFGAKPLLVGTITAQASGPSGVGGAVGISGLGTVAVGIIDTTNTAAVTTSGAKSGSVFLSSGSTASDAILAGTIKAHNSANGSATGQVILIASGTITTFGAITTSAGTIPANIFTSNVVSGSEASITPNYKSDKLSITSSTTVDVSVTGISAPTSNYNPSGYAALSGSSTVLTIDSGGNSSLLAPLVFTAFVPMTITSINSNSSTAADSIALIVFGNLTLSDGINASGTTSGGNVTMQSSAGQISLASIATNSSGAGAAGSINISAWAAIPVTGTINAYNSGTGAGGTVFLASTDNSVATGEIDTSVALGSAAAGTVTITTYGAMSINAINASNSGTGAGGTVLLNSSNSSVTTGEIMTGGSDSAGNVIISAYGAVDTNGNAIQTYNSNTGAGAVFLASTNNSVSTGAIDTYVTGGSGAAGSVTISALGSITLGGDIAAYNTGSGAAGTVSLSAVGNIQTTSPTVKVESPSITLTSVKGNIKSASDTTPLLIQSGLTAGTLSLIAQGSGSVLLADTVMSDNVQFNNTLPVNVSGAGTLFSLKTAGNITQQTTTTAVTSSAIVLETTTGNIGEFGDALQTSSTDTMSINAGGDAYINQTGAFTLLDSHAGGDFQLNSSGSTTINSLASETGSVSVIVGYFGSTLNVAAGSQVTAGNGTLLLENDNTQSGSIVIGANANLTAGSGPVYIVIGPVPFTPVAGPKPADVKVILTSGGKVFFGASGINALAPTNFINANGNNVIFNTGSFSSSAIQLDGNVTINASNAPVLFNLDLTNTQTVAAIQAAQAAKTIGGTLIVSGGIAVGGDVVLKPINISGTLSALNIPANVTVTNNGFSAANPLTINLTATSTTTQVVINGKNQYKGPNTNAVLNINSTLGGTVLVEGASGTLSSQGPLTISGNGNMTFDGVVSGNTIALNTTSASNANLSLGGTIGAASTSSVTFSADGAGTVTQTGGTIAGKNIAASSGTGNIILSNIGSSSSVSANTDGAVTLTALGPLSIQNSSAGSTFTVNSGSTLTLAGAVNALSVTLIGTSLKRSNSAANILANTVTLAAGKGNIGSSNAPILITASNLSITSDKGSKAFINNTGALTIDNTTVGGTLTLTSSAGLTIGNVSTISGSLNLQTAAGALMVIGGDSLSANNGNLLLQNLNTASGTIDIGANAMLTANGSAGGNVTVLIGSTPAPKTNTTTPANVTPIISGTGRIFYGAGSIVASPPTNTITATGRAVIFSGPAGAISLDGGVTINATQVIYGPAPNDNCDEIVDTSDDGEDLDVDDRLLVNSSQ